MKKCNKCLEVKLTSEFYRKSNTTDGFSGLCKSCVGIQNKQYRKTHKEKVILFRRSYQERNKESLREKNRIYRIKNKEICKQRTKDCMKKNKEYYRLKFSLYKQENPEKYRAHLDVGNAVKRGALKKATNCKCAVCGNQAQEYHHPDYSKTLEVTPLCILCHKHIHYRLDEEKKGVI
jgi:hypothetical protein